MNIAGPAPGLGVQAPTPRSAQLCDEGLVPTHRPQRRQLAERVACKGRGRSKLVESGPTSTTHSGQRWPQSPKPQLGRHAKRAPHSKRARTHEWVSATPQIDTELRSCFGAQSNIFGELPDPQRESPATRLAHNAPFLDCANAGLPTKSNRPIGGHARKRGTRVLMGRA